MADGTMGHFSGNYPTDMTVKMFIKQPQLITKTLARQGAGRFIAETLFDRGFNAPGGSVKYQESVSQYMDDSDGEDFAIAEGAEYPEMYMSDEQQSANTRKYAISAWLTFEDVDRNQLGQIPRATTRMLNTIEKNLDGNTMNMLKNNSKIRTYDAQSEWDVKTTETVIDDLLLASEMVEDESSGIFYPADTVVMNTRTHSRLLLNENLRELFKDFPANQRPEFRGAVGTLAGLNVLKSPYVPDDVAFVMSRQSGIGGIADEVPLTLKPIERDEHRDRYWLRAKRLTVAFLTDPNAIVRVNGIKTP